MDSLAGDLRYAVRRLGRSPGFSLVALSILVLGIGLNTAAFSVVNALLFQPPPFEAPGRLVEILQAQDGGGASATSYPAFLDIAEYDTLFTSLGARAFGGGYLDVENGELIPVSIEYATSGYLPVLGLTPGLGRWFEPADDILGGAPVAVITHRFWRNALGGDLSVLGQVIRLNGASVTIVGVGPEAFNGGSGLATGDFWLSFSAMDDTNGRVRSLTRRQDHPLRVVARLAPGVTPGAAQSAMDQLASRLAREYPDANRVRGRDRSIHVLPILRAGAENRGPLVPAVILLMGVVGLVLLVASVNLANLMLVRGMSRAREVGVRLALGGSRSRVVRGVFAETVVLASVGAALGLTLTYWLMTWLGTVELSLAGPTNLDIRLDWAVFVFTIVTAAGASLAAGLLPALRVTSVATTSIMHDARSSGFGKRSGLVGALVGAQVASSLVLLVAAGLFVDGAIRASSADPGFRVDQLAVMAVDLNPLALPDSGVLAMYDALEERIEAIPGVRGVSYARNLPATPGGTTTLLVGDPVDGRRRPVEVPWNVVRGDFFSVLEIPLLHGRLFDRSAGAGDRSRVVVSRAMAEAFWGRSDVVGEVYRTENAPDVGVEIIGVVESTKVVSLDEASTPQVYFDGRQSALTQTNILIRTAGAPGTVLTLARQRIIDLDSRISILSALTMESYLSGTLGRQRFVARILLVIGVFALALAAFGIYAVVSFNVTQRAGEVGIRMALGAGRLAVVGLFLKETGAVVGLGGLVGVALAMPAAYIIAGSFTGTQALLGPVFVASLVTMGLAAILATCLPACRATRLDPAETLRQE
jgi:predicted permease